MGKYCVVCRSSFKSEVARSFHRIPSNIERRSIWLSTILKYLGKETIPKDSVVCSDHFTSDNFSTRPGGRVYLMDSAVPKFSDLHLEIPSPNASPTSAIPINPEDYYIKTESNSSSSSTVSAPETEALLLQLSKFEEENLLMSPRGSDLSDSSINSDDEYIKTESNSSCSPLPASETSQSFPTECLDPLKLPDTSEAPVNSHELLKIEHSYHLPISELESEKQQKRTSRRFQVPRYFGDFKDDDLCSPAKAQMALEMSNKTILKNNVKIAELEDENQQLRSEIDKLLSELQCVKDKYILDSLEDFR